MKKSTTHATGKPDPRINEATQALQRLADEVDIERAQKGRSEIVPPVMSDARAMATEAAFSESRPNSRAISREDHEAGAPGIATRVEDDVVSIFRPIAPRGLRSA